VIYARGACRHGEMVWLARDTHVGRALSMYGEFSEIEVEVLCQLAPVGGVVIEAGANIGALTVPLAKKVGRGGVVIALEPQRLAFQVLCANLVLNEIVNVYALQAAAGEKQGWIAAPVFDPEVEENFGGLELLKEHPPGAPKEGVQMVPLDAIPLARLDLLKADVEGMEAQLIRGAEKTIRRYRPPLYLEHNESISDAPMRASLEAMGYSAYWHLPAMYRKENFKGCADESIFHNIVSINMIFLPKEKNVDVQGFKPIVSGDWRADHGLKAREAHVAG